LWEQSPSHHKTILKHFPDHELSRPIFLPDTPRSAKSPIIWTFNVRRKHGSPTMTQSMTIAPVAVHGFFLDGRWIEDGEAVEIRAPYDGSVIARVTQARREHTEAAISAAVKAFGTTRRLPAFERQRVLRQISAAITERKEEFSFTLAQEAGKPIKAARTEVERSIFTFNVAAEESTRIYGDYLPLDWQESTAGRWGIVRRFPIGPVAGITPFNFPLNLVAHKVAPAIAAGCPMVLKPAPQTPLCSLLLAECVQQAGWPDGGLNVLPLSNEDAGLLITDDRIKLISFTGSVPVGWDIKRRAGKKKVVLELGGNAAVIVHGDADLPYAADRCVTGGFGYAGQTCISVQRILVEQSVYGKFTDLLVDGVKKLKVGDPLDSETDVGPVIRENDAIRTVAWIEEAVRGGARLLCGGGRNGMLVEPTVLTGTNPAMKVNCQEVFGPVVTVEPYTNFDEALREVNHSAYGLQSGLFTRDAKLIFQAYEELEVGGLIAGDVPSFRIDHMPYGGVKDSGLGREGLRYAIEEMTEPKLLVMNLR
jgi:acyl-CoA reductase-like NAD-dependent aldehyde dehydrogenase